MDFSNKECETKNPRVFHMALKLMLEYAAKGHKYALGDCVALLNSKGKIYEIPIPFDDERRADLFREAYDRTFNRSEDKTVVLRELIGKSRFLPSERNKKEE